MCGRFVSAATTAALAERFEVAEVLAAADHPPSWNVAPSAEPRVVLDRPGDPRRLVTLRWGLVPRWAPDPSVGNRLTNARAEGAGRRRAFAPALSQRRCLVPADGFYEWSRVEDGTRRGGRQPWWFRRRDGDVMALGGLWETWRGPDGVLLRTFCLITTAANVDLEGIHDRMPVMVEPEDWDRWLDPRMTEPEQLADLLSPAPYPRLDRHPVSSRVNRADVDGPELIHPVEPAPERSPRLFGGTEA